MPSLAALKLVKTMYRVLLQPGPRLGFLGMFLMPNGSLMMADEPKAPKREQIPFEVRERIAAILDELHAKKVIKLSEWAGNNPLTYGKFFANRGIGPELIKEAYEGHHAALKDMPLLEAFMFTQKEQLVPILAQHALLEELSKLWDYVCQPPGSKTTTPAQALRSSKVSPAQAAKTKKKMLEYGKVAKKAWKRFMDKQRREQAKQRKVKTSKRVAKKPAGQRKASGVMKVIQGKSKASASSAMKVRKMMKVTNGRTTAKRAV